MKKSTTFFIVGAMIYIVGFITVSIIGFENIFGYAILLVVIGGFLFIRGSALQDYEEEEENDERITGKYIESLNTFGKEQDGTYCDRWAFSIIPIRNQRKEIIKWSFCIFNEVDGRNTRVKYVETVGELKAIYKAVSNKELV